MFWSKAAENFSAERLFMMRERLTSFLGTESTLKERLNTVMVSDVQFL